MKFRYAIATVIAMVVVFGSRAAETFEYGNYNDNNLTCTLVKYNGGDTGELTIPNNHKRGGTTYKVNRVARRVFNGLPSLRVVNIGANLAVIGGSDGNVSLISERTVDNFFACPKLEKFVVSSDNRYFASTGAGLLVNKDCTALLRVPSSMKVTDGKLTMSDSFTKVFPRAFAGNTTITTLRIGKNLDIIYNDGGLSNMPNLKTYEVATGNTRFFVTSDGLLMRLRSSDSAGIVNMPRRTSITSYKVPSTVKPAGKSLYVNAVEEYAFANLTKLTSITFGAYIEAIEEGAFAHSGLTSITIPNTVERLGDGMLADNKALTTITIKGSDISIPDNFARDCRALTSVAMDEVPSVLGKAAFKNCTSLTSFPFGGLTSLRGDSIFANTGFTEIVYRGGLHIPLGNYVGIFTGCRNLTSIDLSAISLDSDASYNCGQGFATNCSKLNTLIFPSSVMLRPQSFGNNNALRTVVLNNFSAPEGGVFGFTEDASPRAYVVSRKVYPEVDTETGNLFKAQSGVTLTPRIYMDAFDPSPDAEAGDDPQDKNATYYIPGATYNNYNRCANRTEMFSVKVTNRNGKARFTIKPAWSGVKMKTINAGKGSVDIPSDGIVDTTADFFNLPGVMISYSVNDVDMLTRYPSGYLTSPEAGVADIEIDAAPGAPAEYYTIAGMKVTGTPAPGLYIVRRGDTVTKELVK